MVGLRLGGWKLRSIRRSDVFLAVCICYSLWLIYRNLGVFVGSIRADEIHFLQNAWMAYVGQPSLKYVPPLYDYFVYFFWWICGGDLNSVYALRLFNFALFFTQTVLTFFILSISFGSFRGRYFALLYAVLSLSFVTVLSAFRGFEIRPEGLGNTLLLFAFLWLALDRKIDNWISYSQFLAVSVLLVLAASMSLRFVLPAFFLWVAVVMQMHWNNQLKRIRGIYAFLLVGGICILVATAVVYLLVDWNQVRESMGRHANTAVPMSAMTRFTINVWAGYKLIGVICIMGAVLGAVCATCQSKATVRLRIVNGLLILPLLSFYFFLFFWDSNPRGYIHSIEWVLIFGLALFSVRTAVVSIRASALVLFVLTSALYLLSHGAINELFSSRNTEYFLKNNLKALDAQGWVDKSDSSLLKDFDINKGLVDQVESRREFCMRHAGSFVVAGIITAHPICLIDRGTYDFSGWGNKDVDLLGVPPDQGLIVLAAEDTKLTPLAKHYGDRYETRGGVSIIRKR